MATETSPPVDDRQQFYRQHELIWGRHNWPEGTLMSVCHQYVNPTSGRKDAFSSTGHAPVNSPEGIWNLIEKHASKGANTYVSVGGMNLPEGQNGRGRAADVVGLPALVADLDVQGGAHSADNLPTEAEALAWIAAMPLPATVVIHTGGGFHVWVALSELIDPNTDAGRSVLKAWKAWWVAIARRFGRAIDVGVLADAARVLRPSGTVNAKRAPLPVNIISTDESAVHSPKAIMESFSAPDAPSDPAIVPNPAPNKPSSSPAATKDGGEKLGSQFAREVGAGDFAVAVFSAHRIGADRLVLPRPDGSYASDSNAQIYAANAGGPERVVIFGDRVKSEWSERGVGEPYGGNSFELLARVVLGGDFKSAARLLRRNESTDGTWSSLLDAAHSIFSGEVEADEAVAPLSLRDALQSSEVESIPLGDGDVVTVNGSYHGLAYLSKDANGVFTTRTVVDFVAWKSKAAESWAVNSSGHRVETGEATYTVDLVRRDRRRFTAGGFTASNAHNPVTVTDRLNAGVKLPTSSTDRRRVENMLRSLGSEDSLELTSQFTATGWLVEDGAPAVFLAPAGSVTAAGVTKAFSVVEPIGSQAGALQPAQRLLGWDTVPVTPEELVAAASSIDAFLRIAPKRRDLGIALLGAMFAAPLALSTRTTVILHAKPGVGKSQMASATQSFYSGVGVDGRSFTMTLGKGSTAVSAEIIASWGRHALSFYDDFRFIGSPKDDATMSSVVSTIVQSNYGSDGASKGTQAGGIRSSRTADGVGVITAETMPTSEAIVSRSVGVELRPGDIKMEPRGASPFDLFVKQFAESGLARSMNAHYLAFLAARIDEFGNLAEFRRANDARKNSWFSERGGRTTETASVLAAGWMIARDWATANGIEHLLPTQEEIDETLNAIVETNEAATADSNPAMQIVEKARDMLHGSTGYLRPHHRGDPAVYPELYGWERVETAWEVRWEHGNRKLLGVASIDGKHIALVADAARSIQTTLGLGGLSKDQIRRGFEALVDPRTVPGAQAPAFLGINGRPRAYVLPTSLFDVELPELGATDETSAIVPAEAALSEADAMGARWVAYCEELLADLFELGIPVGEDFLADNMREIEAVYESGFADVSAGKYLASAARKWQEGNSDFS